MWNTPPFEQVCASVGADLTKAELEVLVPQTDMWDQVQYEKVSRSIPSLYPIPLLR